MPGYLGLQVSLELTNLLPIKEAVIAAGSYLLSFARDLKASGSDIVVEADVASVFGRGVIQREVENNFRQAVSVTTVTPLPNAPLIELHGGPGPTIVHAFSPEAMYHLRTIITLSFLGYFVDRQRLAAMISEGMAKRVENRLDHEWRNVGVQSVDGMLTACSTQTASFSWAAYRQAVEQRFQAVSNYRFHPDYLSMTPTLMLGSMDFLYAVQSLPKDRHVTISGQKGWILIVIWAHYLLGLNVVVQRGQEKIIYGDDAEPHVTIRWSTEASAPSQQGIPIHYPLENDESDVEIYLYDASMSVQLGCAPEDGDQHFRSVRERHPLTGYGTTYLRRLLNTDCITSDQDPIFEEIPNLVMGIAAVAAQNRDRYAQLDMPPGPAEHITKAPQVCTEIWRVMTAGEMIFSGLSVNKDSVASYRSFFSKTNLDKATLPSAFNGYLRRAAGAGPAYIIPPDERLIGQIAHLAEMVVLFSQVYDLQKCAQMPIIMEGLPERGQLRYYHTLAANETNHGRVRPEDVLNGLAYFISAVHRPELELDQNAAFLSQKQAHSFLYSDFGWSVFLDSVMERAGTKDPADVRPDLIHIEKGTPTNTKTGERRYCMKDATDHSVPWPDNWEIERGPKYTPRAVGHVVGTREFWSTQMDHFELKIQIELRHPNRQHRVWREILGCKSMHEALWRVFTTPACPHAAERASVGTPAKREVKLGPDAVAILGWSYTQSMRCSEKVLIFLTRGDCHLRWVAISGTRSFGRREIGLRTLTCCEECALDYFSSKPGKWVLIL